jgi:hypothetical protein
MAMLFVVALICIEFIGKTSRDKQHYARVTFDKRPFVRLNDAAGG